MANYLITKQDDPTIITVVDGQLNQQFTLPLLGQNYIGYGAHIAQNQLRSLENFCSDTPPANAVRGQLWYKMPPGYTFNTVGELMVWTGKDPADGGFNSLIDGSQNMANIAQWVVVGPDGISGGNIGSIGTPYNNIYCANVYASGQGSFGSLFVGSGVNGLTINSTSLLPDPDSINNTTGMFLGNSTHRFRESHVRNEFIYGSLNVGDFATNKNVKLIADTTQNYTLLPDPAQTVHLGMSTTPTKRFESVNTKNTNTTSLEVGTGAGEGIGTDLNPKINSNYNLGNSSYKYANVFADSVNVETVKRLSATSKVGELAAPFLEMHATTFYGTATQARYADIAERYEADVPYEYGTVVKLGGDKEITQTTTAFDVDVFGVISKQPAYMMNAAAGNDESHPYVALAGRVPVRVYGPVRKNQKLVSSAYSGVAIAVDTADITNVLHIIGRALEDKIDGEFGYVEAVVGVR